MLTNNTRTALLKIIQSGSVEAAKIRNQKAVRDLVLLKMIEKSTDSGLLVPTDLGRRMALAWLSKQIAFFGERAVNAL